VQKKQYYNMERDNALLLALLISKKREVEKTQTTTQTRRKHKVWVRKLLTERNWKGEYHILVKEMILFDHEFFYKQFRMSPARYETLLKLVAPLITKCSLRREAISASARLYMTLYAVVIPM